MDDIKTLFVHFPEHSETLSNLCQFISQPNNKSCFLLGGRSGFGKSRILNHALKLQPSDAIVLSLEIDRKNYQMHGLTFLTDQLIQILLKEEAIFGFKWKKLLNSTNSDYSILITKKNKLDSLVNQRTYNLRPLERAALVKKTCKDLFYLYSVHGAYQIQLAIDNIDYADEEFTQDLQNLFSAYSSTNIKLIGTCLDAKSMQTKLFGRPSQYNVLQSISKLTNSSLKNLLDAYADSGKVSLSKENTEWILERANGNPENAIQCFEYLKDTNFIRPISALSQAAMLKERVSQFNGIERQVLATIAVYGNKISLADLYKLFKSFEASVDSCLEMAKTKGLLTCEGEYFLFKNERIRSTCSNLCGGYHTKAIHYRIARFLIVQRASKNRSANILDITNHLLASKDYDLNNFSNTERVKIIREAAEYTLSISDFSLMYLYAKSGLSYINDSTWPTAFDDCLNLYLLCQRASYLTNDLQTMEKCTKEILERTNNIGLRADAICNAVDGYLSKNETEKAVSLAIKGLNELGVPLSPNPGVIRTSATVALTWKKLAATTPNTISQLKICSDDRQLNASKLLIKVAMSTYGSHANLFVLSSCLIINSTLSNGISPETRTAIQVFCSSVITGYFKRLKQGRTISSMWSNIKPTQTDYVNNPRSNFLFNAFIDYHTRDLKENVARLDKNFEQNLEVGAYEIAAYTAHVRSFHSLDGAEKLPSIAKKIETFTDDLGNITQQNADRWISILRQLVSDLIEPNTHSRLMGKYFNIEIDLSPDVYLEDKASVFIAHHYSVVKATLLGKTSLAYKCSQVSQKYRKSVVGTLGEYLSVFINSIAITKLAFQDHFYLSAAKKSLKKSRIQLQQVCDQTSINLEHKLTLLTTLHSILCSLNQHNAEDLSEVLTEQAEHMQYKGYLLDSLITYELIYDAFPSLNNISSLYKSKDIALDWGAIQIANRIEERILDIGKSSYNQKPAISTRIVHDQVLSCINALNTSNLCEADLIDLAKNSINKITSATTYWIGHDNPHFNELHESSKSLNALNRRESIKLSAIADKELAIFPVDSNQHSIGYFLIESDTINRMPLLKDAIDAICKTLSTNHSLRISGKSLRQVENTYDSLFANAPYGIAIATIDGSLDKTNRKFIDILELNNITLINENIFSIIESLIISDQEKSNDLNLFKRGYSNTFSIKLTDNQNFRSTDFYLHASNSSGHGSVFCQAIESTIKRPKSVPVDKPTSKRFNKSRTLELVTSPNNIQHLDTNKASQTEREHSIALIMLEKAIINQDIANTRTSLLTIKNYAQTIRRPGLNHIITRFMAEIESSSTEKDWLRFQNEYLPVCTEILKTTANDIG